MSGFLAFLMAGADDNSALTALLDTPAPLEDSTLEELAKFIAPAGTSDFHDMIRDVINYSPGLGWMDGGS